MIQWAGQGISDAGDWIYDNASFLGHAAWYSWEGDYTNAALSTASAAIGVGIGVTLVKYGKIILDAAG